MNPPESNLVRRALLVTAAMLLALAAPARGPSTPGERQAALRLIRSLEERPLQEGYKEKRAWLWQWLSEVPDITVKVCAGPFAPLLDEEDEDKPYGGDIFFQSTFSSAAFILENPDRAKDDVAVYRAGIEGALKVYAHYLAEDPRTRRPCLDELVRAREAGTLDTVAREALKSCSYREP